uniref:Transmembrane protein n=1 Tax=Steinernema glaseri TaxID=37863 RepID=A0A1I7Z5I2_9BILA
MTGNTTHVDSVRTLFLEMANARRTTYYLIIEPPIKDPDISSFPVLSAPECALKPVPSVQSLLVPLDSEKDPATIPSQLITSVVVYVLFGAVRYKV